MAGTIFICYRRDDSAGHAGRLFDRLSLDFPGRVFMDVAGISPGQRWADVIQQTITACDVAIVLIGPRWLTAGADGQPRLHAADDPVRGEIASALAHGVKIVPVLVGGAGLPVASQLPTDIAGLLDWQTLRVDDDEFQHDLGKLLRALRDLLGETPASRTAETTATSDAAVGRIMAPVPVSPRGVRWAMPALVLILLAIAGAWYLGRSLNGSGNGASDDRPRERPLAPDTVVASQSRNLNSAPNNAAAGVGSPTAGGAGARQPSPPESSSRTAGTAGATTPGGDRDPAALSRQLRWAGLYNLESWRRDGARREVTGTMQMTRIADGRFRFDIRVTNRQGEVASYQGSLEGGDTSWTTTISRSNDRRATRTPVVQTVTFDGTTLKMESATETVVWKRP